jgi:hypothetical protein
MKASERACIFHDYVGIMNRDRRCSLTKRAGIFLYRNFSAQNILFILQILSEPRPSIRAVLRFLRVLRVEKSSSIQRRARIFLYRNFRRPIKLKQALPHSAFHGWPAIEPNGNLSSSSCESCLSLFFVTFASFMLRTSVRFIAWWVPVDSQFILFILFILSAPLGFRMVTGQKQKSAKRNGKGTGKEQKGTEKEHKGTKKNTIEHQHFFSRNHNIWAWTS